MLSDELFEIYEPYVEANLNYDMARYIDQLEKKGF
jgi:hypothetical protein